MKTFLILTLLSFQAYSDITPRRELDKIEKELFQDKSLITLAKYSDKAIEGVLQVAITQLRKEGFHDDAAKIERDYYFAFKGFLERSFSKDDVEDQKPLIEWLDNVYQLIEWRLGLPTCRALRISDLRTVNNCLKPVFHPCDFPVTEGETRRQEYNELFTEGKNYRGLAPVVVYWAFSIACSAATSGAGALACSPAAAAAEWVFKKTISPRLASKIQDRCN